MTSSFIGWSIHNSLAFKRHKKYAFINEKRGFNSFASILLTALKLLPVQEMAVKPVNHL
jgi:hypothetical protein